MMIFILALPPSPRSSKFQRKLIFLDFQISRLGWLNHQDTRVIERPMSELFVQETKIAWR